MIGVVGKVKFSYWVNDVFYEEKYDLAFSREIRLSGVEGVAFRVEEVNYIEDTVYGATLSMIEPRLLIDEYMIGSERATFEIKDKNLKGFMELAFFS